MGSSIVAESYAAISRSAMAPRSAPAALSKVTTYTRDRKTPSQSSRYRRHGLARVEQFDCNNAALSVIVEYDAFGDLLAFQDARVREAHVERIAVGVIKRLHGRNSCRSQMHGFF